MQPQVLKLFIDAVEGVDGSELLRQQLPEIFAADVTTRALSLQLLDGHPERFFPLFGLPLVTSVARRAT